MNEEIWKDIEGYKGAYQISNLGNVKSVEREVTQWNESAKKYVTRIQKALIMKPFEDEDGYLRLQLIKDGIRKKHFVHRLVALAFIPNPENKPEVNHKQGDKKDNRVWMLEWSTSSENQRHAIANKLYETAKGEKSGQAKLTELQVREIHSLYSRGNITQEYLAGLYGVASSAISRILTGVRWNHIYKELYGD